jgi:transmembrane sensor
MERGSEASADEAAARWLARLNARSVTTEELNEFYAWRRNPANAAAYARAERIWRDARQIEADPQIAAAIDEALERPRSRGLWARPNRRLLIGGLTAVPVGIAGAVGLWAYSRPEIHETMPDERLAFALPDGTRVHLNSDSRVAVRLSEHERRIELERGEALFAVKRDPARPFIVATNGQTVRALGTSFSTRRADQALRVVLIEGQVEVTSPNARPVRLAQPGAAASVRLGQQIVSGTADFEAETAWTRGKLLFRQIELASAVSQVNRYSARKIELADGLGGRRVDGSFDIGDSESFVAAVTTIFDLRARREGNRIRLEPAPNGPAKKSSPSS